MLKKIATSALASVMLLTTMSADAALNAYVWVKGQKQGQIKGGVTQKGREDSIMAFAVSHAIISPRDQASGLPSGKRMHKPYVITKELDKSSPLLYNALVNNENLTEITIKFFAPQLKAATGTGAEVNNFTVKLTNANIASIDFKLVKNPETQKEEVMEEVAFTYQKINWTWNDGGITATDDWRSP